MTAVAAPSRRSLPWRAASIDREVPPLSQRLELTRALLLFVGAIAGGLVLQLTIMSTLQQRSSQQHAFDAFRSALAKGTAPIGPADQKHRLLALGTPVAYLEVPSIGVRQVVGEGTTTRALFTGPGHRRDTPLPGQPGTSLIAGRRAAYGGPFAHINNLKKDAIIHVTTGQGVFDYRVLGVRHSGDPLPRPYPAGSGRLVLATADGHSFMPSDVVWVDADLKVPAVGGPGGRVATNALPPSEKLMATDTGTLWALALWLQAVLVVVLGAVYAWQRWNRAKAWMVFLPPLLLVSVSAAGEFAKLIPNLT